MSNLNNLENMILSETQQSELVNFAGAPNWAASTNPSMNQAKVDYYINRAVMWALRGVAELEIASFRAQFLSVANTTNYNVPPPIAGTPNPPCHLIQRVYYAPLGQNYTLEMEPGIRLLPWKTFQRAVWAGYLSPFSFGPQPFICSMTPNRKQIAFYPGTATNGDTITFDYSPIPTTGTLVPPLVAGTDVPILPDEYDDMIVQYAAPPLWRSLREFGAANNAEKLAQAMLEEAIKHGLKRTKGDKMQITDARDDFTTSGPFPLYSDALGWYW